MLSHRAALKFKRNVGTFKCFNLWQPFPLRFLAGHSPTCWGLFPAPSIVPEIKKMTAVILWELNLFLKDLLVIPLRVFLNLNKGDDKPKTSWFFGNMKQPCGQPGALVCLGNRKIEAVLERTDLNPKTVESKNSHSIKFTFGWFSSVCQIPQTWLPGAQRNGLTGCSLRGTKSPTEPYAFLQDGLN